MNFRSRRTLPFLVSGIVLFIACLAIARLPDAYASRLERNSPFTVTQDGWAFRLLALAAVAQAAYGGFVLFQVEKVRKTLTRDVKIAAMPRDRLATSIARNAAGMVLLTVVYGTAAFYVRGQRGGFWLFAVIAAAQGLWYFRQVGQIERWLNLQPEAGTERRKREATWKREPPDYSPPLGR